MKKEAYNIKTNDAIERAQGPINQAVSMETQEKMLI